MTDNEIIEVLEWCTNVMDCGKCLYSPYSGSGCATRLKTEVLDLIKRQQEEIEKLKNEKVKHHLIATAVIDEDVLKKFMDEWLKKVECDIIKVRNETIKEFAERLKALSTYGTVNLSPWQIDNLVKEMTEGKDAGKDI